MASDGRVSRLIDPTGDDCNENGIPEKCDTDSDGHGVIDDCEDCPHDSEKVEPGVCGCGVPDEGDEDNDGFLDCVDECPGVDDAIFASECREAIPTVTGWGLVIFSLLLLVAGKLYFGWATRQATS